MFTILNEFPQYTEHDVLSFSPAKLNVVYKEALRQRASKYELLSQLINQIHISKDSDRQKLNQSIDKMLKPHLVVEEVDSKQVDAAWDILRKRV